MAVFFDISIYIALVLLASVAFLVLYRLVIGPSIADRVTAFDVLTCIVIGIISVFAIRTGDRRYIDVVLTLSFVVFLGAIAFSYFLRQQRKQ